MQTEAKMARDDRLTLLFRLAFTPLAFFTAIFGPLLVIFPGSTDVFWSWQIKPEMSAVWIGAGYTFGGIAITTMLVVGKWSASTVALAGTWPFSLAMLGATLLHLDRFFVSTPRFWIWLLIYVALPILLPVLYLTNMRRDPGPNLTDVRLPDIFRAALVGGGILFTLLGLFLFFAPSAADAIWPWQLTPLMSQVIGGWLLFIGAGSLCALYERRYIAYRYFLPSAAVWFTILLIASLFNLGNFIPNRFSVIIFFVALPIVISGIIGMFLIMERRRQKQNSQHLPTLVPNLQ